jgi:hypothetical protein
MSHLLKKYFNLLINNPTLWNLNSIQKSVNNQKLDAGDFPNNIVEYLWTSKDKIRWDHEINSFMKLNNGNFAYFYSGETRGGFVKAIAEKKFMSENIIINDEDDIFFATIMELYICRTLDELVDLIKMNPNPLIYKYYLLDINKS